MVPYIGIAVAMAWSNAVPSRGRRGGGGKKYGFGSVTFGSCVPARPFELGCFALKP